jgi:uncharacterized protein (TIGR03437 family)
VVLNANGRGVTNPFSKDGAIITRLPFPAPVLLVTVLIGDQHAEVIYAGQLRES